MIRPFEQALLRYGQTVTVFHEGVGVEVRAFLQEKLEKREEPPRSIHPLGEVDRRRWVYIGPAEQEIAFGETLTVDGKDYMVRRVEPVYYMEEVAYYWAMCVEKGGEDTWGRS